MEPESNDVEQIELTGVYVATTKLELIGGRGEEGGGGERCVMIRHGSIGFGRIL